MDVLHSNWWSSLWAQAVIVSSPYSPSETGLIPTFLLILPKASACA